MWGNVAEAPGKPFSRSGARLANVLYIHYLSKVPASLLKPVSHATCSPEPSFCQLTPEAGVQEVLGIVKIA